MIGLITFIAAYLQLQNDSDSYLYVKVYGADGALITQTSMAPQQFNIFSDVYLDPSQNPTMSQTPYLVHWYCSDGGKDYSICNDVSDGALVTASSCSGSKQCPVKKVPKQDKLPDNFGNGFEHPPQFPPEENDQSSQSP